MRLPLLALGVAVLAALGCGDSDGTGSSCAATVRWNQTLYVGLSIRAPQGAVLGRGVVPACTPDEHDQRVTIRRVANVPPALAVAREEEPPGQSAVYLAPGFFRVLADHPLHRRPVRPRRCSARFRLTGTVVRTPTSSVVPLQIDGRRLPASVVTSTDIIGFRRAGHPYLQRRDLVMVRGRRCDLPAYDRAYVADVVTPAD
jgi:hypothetical protein